EIRDRPRMGAEFCQARSRKSARTRYRPAGIASLHSRGRPADAKARAKVFREGNRLNRFGACHALLRKQAAQRTRGIVAQVLEESGCSSAFCNRHLVSAGDNTVAV